MNFAAAPGLVPSNRAAASDGRGRWRIAILVVCAFAALWFSWSPGRDSPLTNPVDFRAFYCSGLALAEGADPYRVEPVTSCQTAFLAASRLAFDPRHALFAPLPPYAIAPFALLSHLAPRVAIDVWLALCLVAVFLTIRFLRRLTGLPTWACVVSVAASDAWASLVLGQLVPVALAAILFVALSLRERRWSGVSVGLVVASLEPHLAAPLWIGALLFAPAARVRVVVAGIALAAVSLALGPKLNVEYFITLLASHARSELHNFGPQYSLSALLAAYGTPDAYALRLGAISYAVMLVAGIVLGRRLATRFGDDAFLALGPVACIVFAGPFIHIHQMAVAIPLALALLAHERRASVRHALLVAATIALAIPWETVAESPLVADRRHDAPLAVAAGPRLDPVTPHEFIEIPYTQYVDAYADRADRRSRLEKTLWKLPTWLALLALIGVGFASLAKRSEPRQSRSALRFAIRR